jgi:NTE family protein
VIHVLEHRAFRKRALVLGGGGALGAVQAAYVLAAFERGFIPDVVVGTSVGALNGAWLALHPDDPEGLVRTWRELGDVRIMHWNPVRLAAKVAHGRGLQEHDIVPRLIAAHIRDFEFDDTVLGFAVVATNLSRGTKKVFSEGPLAPAIMASTAIPGIYEPVAIEGDLYVDGCLTASVDLATAAQMGATDILAIALSPPVATRTPNTLIGVLRQSLGILTHATVEAMEQCLSGQVHLRIVRPDLARLSPWRLQDTPGTMAAYLVAARDEMSHVLDSDGVLLAEQDLPRLAPMGTLRRQHQAWSPPERRAS